MVSELVEDFNMKIRRLEVLEERLGNRPYVARDPCFNQDSTNIKVGHVCPGEKGMVEFGAPLGSS